MRITFTCLIIIFSGLFSLLQAQAFNSNSIVILRVGSMDSAISNRSREIFLHEYDTATGALIRMINIPFTGADKLTLTGTSATEGMLKRSVNGAYLTFGGYDLGLGVGSPSSTGTNATRVIGRVSANGTLDLSTKVPMAQMHSNGQLRAVVSNDGSGYWTAGGSNGVRYAEHGSNTAKNLSATVTNMRSIGIYDNKLYLCHSSGTAMSRVYQVGATLSSTDSVGATTLPDIPSTSITASDFYMVDLSDAVPGPDVLYIADEGATGGIIKYSLVGGVWVETGKIANSLDGATTYRSIAGEKTATGVVLFGARSSSTQLFKLYDIGGYNGPITGTPVVLATAEANTAFRGVAFAPKDIVAPLTLVSFSGSNISGKHLLNWKTANELNTSNFEIQISRNTLEFEAAGNVTANNANGEHTYRFSYSPVAKGDYYYRLKMIDRDGSFTFSQVIRLQSNTGASLSAFPNPSRNGMLLITHEVAEKGTSLRLVAADGRVATTLAVQEGSTQTSLTVSPYQKGIYRVVLSGKKEIQSVSVIIE
jgi:hypothetical protein